MHPSGSCRKKLETSLHLTQRELKAGNWLPKGGKSWEAKKRQWDGPQKKSTAERPYSPKAIEGSTWVLSPFSRVQLFEIFLTVACRAPLSMELSRQEVGFHVLLQGIFPTQGPNLCPLPLQACPLPLAQPRKPNRGKGLPYSSRSWRLKPQRKSRLLPETLPKAERWGWEKTDPGLPCLCLQPPTHAPHWPNRGRW